MSIDIGGEMRPGGFGDVLPSIERPDGNQGLDNSIDAISEFPDSSGLMSDPIEYFSGPGAEFFAADGFKEF